MPSTNSITDKLTAKQKDNLLKVAREAIQYGFTHKRPPKIELKKYSPQLQAEAATFVTLKLVNQLRGCIGTLEAYQPLAQDVADHAYSAAFTDPRFPPLEQDEEPQLHISISILSKPEQIPFETEQELIEQLKPGLDGLIMQYGQHKGTFLPSVWKELPEKQEFLGHLKQKAGLPSDFWSKDIRVSRYHTELID